MSAVFVDCELSSKVTCISVYLKSFSLRSLFSLRWKYSILWEKYELVLERIFMRASLFPSFFRQNEREEKTERERDRHTDSPLENDSREKLNLDWSLCLKLAIVNKPCLSTPTSSEMITLMIFKRPFKWSSKVSSNWTHSMILLKMRTTNLKKKEQNRCPKEAYSTVYLI